jgi:hypothetical protein
VRPPTKLVVRLVAQDAGRCANFGTDRQQRVVLRRPRPSDDHGHWLDLWRGDLPIVLRQDDDTQRLDTSAAPSEIGSIFGCHHPGRLLVLRLFTTTSGHRRSPAHRP